MNIEIKEMLSTELLKILNEDRAKRDRVPINHAYLLTTIKQRFNFARKEENLRVKKILVGNKEKQVLFLTKEQVREVLLREHEEYRESVVSILERVESFKSRKGEN